MRLFKLLCVLGCTACMLTTCENDQDQLMENQLTETNYQKNSSKTVEVPYKANYHTSQADDAFSQLCSSNSPTDFWGQDHQLGYGNATHLGNFTVDLEFCFHVVLDSEGQPDFDAGFGEFSGADNILEANSGDLLFTTSSGSQLIPIQDENYVFEFENHLTVTGGTGKFENATGEIINYGMVRNDGSGTDHHQEGTLILVK